MLPTIVPAPPISAPPAPARRPSDEEEAYYRLNRRVWGSWFASIYDVITFPLRRLRHRVARLAGVTHGMRVIDVATGTGAQARAFAEAGAGVVGVDLQPRMLGIARRKTHDAKVTYLEGDATALTQPDGSFDAACVSFGLHEMPATVRTRVLAELVRVTRPGGTIIVVDYGVPRNRVWRALATRFIALYERDHYAEFVRSDVLAALAAAGVAVRLDQRAFLGGARILVGTR